MGVPMRTATFDAVADETITREPIAAAGTRS
jgi:hypothetical protein